MYLHNFKALNFRNLEEIDIELSPGLNLLLGPNGQGKTNCLEAIHYLATATSPRTKRIDDLLRKGETTAYLKGELHNKKDNPKILEFGFNKREKNIKLNGSSLPRIADLFGHLRVVFFSPSDLNILSGAPDERRRFIDIAIAQINPDYVRQLQEYKYILRQRNLILRKQSYQGIDNLELETWDQEFIKAGVKVQQHRSIACEKLGNFLEKEYAQLTRHLEKVSLIYQSDIKGETESEKTESFTSLLQERLENDLVQGSTSVGPHREDIKFLINGEDMRVFASQGQLRSAALSLRLAEIDLLDSEVGEIPVLLIDDVIYEMDESRRESFLELITRDGQSIITATSSDNLKSIAKRAKHFSVSHGSLCVT
jgi:DNA replication and repair protein RecF